ncbi:hypothetical protein Q8A67_017776 [Cirrhinus molitorella]|uniref:Uncharacterized protein n=1 Tax=Cirrhinus molitorella TaxID=172907 RepID=A0AA88TIN6_9TELE|nr:hypothetical protein Q8A67_017776 [Cirrhinus molitorella]
MPGNRVGSNQHVVNGNGGTRSPLSQRRERRSLPETSHPQRERSSSAENSFWPLIRQPKLVPGPEETWAPRLPESSDRKKSHVTHQIIPAMTSWELMAAFKCLDLAAFTPYLLITSPPLHYSSPLGSTTPYLCSW